MQELEGRVPAGEDHVRALGQAALQEGLQWGQLVRRYAGALLDSAHPSGIRTCCRVHRNGDSWIRWDIEPGDARLVRQSDTSGAVGLQKCHA